MAKIESLYDSRGGSPNDTFVVLKCREDGVPVDELAFPREGNKVKVRGVWVSTKEALKYATERLTGKRGI